MQYDIVAGSDIYGSYSELRLNWLSAQGRVFDSTVRAYSVLSAVMMAQSFPKGLAAAPPGGVLTAVLLGYPAFETKQRAADLNAISFGGCQDASSALLNFTNNSNLAVNDVGSLPFVLLNRQ